MPIQPLSGGNGIEFIMVSHISLPNFHGTELPATLSESVVTGKLRKEMGYEGIIITDSMNMGAVSSHYAAGEAAVLAVTAGGEMVSWASAPASSGWVSASRWYS